MTSTDLRPAASQRPATGLVRSASAVRLALLAVLAGTAEVAVRVGWIDDLVMPPPTEVVGAAFDVASTARFRADLVASIEVVAVSFAAGVLGGIVVGIACSRFRLVATAVEPYLVTLYAAPMVVFYPVLLAVFGLGSTPIVILASITALVPVALATSAALQAVDPVLAKLARSMNCTGVQRYVMVLLPAAFPLLLPGVRLGYVYALIATTAMEFLLASNGLGARVAFEYRTFETVSMWVHIAVIAAIAISGNSLFTMLERRVRRDRT